MTLAVGDKILVSAPLREYYVFGKITFPDLTPNFIFGSSIALQEACNCRQGESTTRSNRSAFPN